MEHALRLLLDANPLVYAAVPAMVEHLAARSWLQERYEDPTELVGVCWPTLFAFTRVVSSHRIMGDTAAPPGDAWTAAVAFARQTTRGSSSLGPAMGRWWLSSWPHLA